MDVVGAIGGAIGAAAWALAGARVVARLRPRIQMSVFTAGTVACALAGGLTGSALAGPRPETVQTVSLVPAPEPTTTTVTTEPPTTTTVATTTTTTAPPVAKPVVKKRITVPRTTRLPAPTQTVTGRCADGWGFYGHNEFTHTCDSHGGFGYWVS